MNNFNNVNNRLTDEKGKLYELLLKKRGIISSQAASIPKRDKAEKLELSFAQQRLWFLHQLDPEGSSYNIPLVVQITGLLSLEALTRSINKVISRHEMMRTVFSEQDGQPWQTIMDHMEINIDLIQIDENCIKEETIHQISSQETRKPFDLSKGPLMRALLLKFDDQHHTLIITMHHIITDGWSLGIIIKEIATFYDYFANRKPIELPELRIQYADFSLWQRRWMQGEKLEKELNYWKNYLNGAAPYLELPTDFQRPVVQTSNGSIKKFELGTALINKLSEFGRNEGATLFMVLLAAFKTLLYRYTMQEDIVLGTPVAGRNHPDIENLIGFFVNTLVIRTKITPNLKFCELLKLIKDETLESYSNQDLPFEKLVEGLHVERNLQYTPVFQVMFAFQNAPATEANLHGLKLSPVSIDSKFAQFDLSITLWEEKGQYTGTIEYNTDLYLPSTIERMEGHYKSLLECIANNPQQCISDLDMLTNVEFNQVAIEWNKTEKEYPKESCIVQFFEKQVQKTPENIAVIYEESCLTYKELDKKSSQLANYLIKQGIGTQDIVALYADCSLETAIGVLGILKAGGAYVPLESGYPSERVEYILNDTGARIILTQNSLVRNLPECGLKVVCLDTGWNTVVADEKDYSPSNDVHKAENLVCVIYTSGTTGKPKGVMIENKSMVNLISSFISSYNAGKNDRILPLTSVASASFAGEIFPIICAGGTLVLANKLSFLNFEMLMDLISSNKVTIISTVPSVIARMNSENIKLPGLRLILSGGEPLLPSNINNLIQSTTIVNGYGLTETTICSTFQILNPSNYNIYPVVSIGKPIINNRIYILDRNLKLVPIGCPGEIYISGDGLAKGYLNNPELTAQRFIQNPYLPDEKMYKTGDFASWLPDGNIKYIGRMDKQVKIRGYRIEVEEVENRINQHPNVENSFVMVREDIPGDKRLIAYMVLRDDMDAAGIQIRNWLVDRLPEYMIPSSFMILDKLPLNSNCKVDVNMLPIPGRDRPNLNNSFEMPKTEIEQKIADIWKEVLNIDSVGVKDNFFDLGGHSLMITQVHSKLRKSIEKEITIIDLFRYPTIKLLADYICQSTNEDDSACTIRERAEKQRSALIERKNIRSIIKNSIND